ncbi:MAG: hypothetical protein PF572_03100 [Patescibacteria group bacterium]|jgi:hypothetical protein|nr:hypothetical protein [Patescibacteria group bacterium]
MNNTKKEKSSSDDDATRLRERLSNPASSPIDDVVGMMLKSDAKSCKLASARLSQIEEKDSSANSGQAEGKK